MDNRIYGEEDGSLKLESSDEKILIDVSGTQEDILALLSKQKKNVMRISILCLFIEKIFNNKSTKSLEKLAEIVSSNSNIILPNESFEKIPTDISIDLSNIGIWIDPVDGTQQYIYGTDGIIDSDTGITLDGLPAALVLIGCFDIKNGRAVLGVINRAFNKKINEHT